MGNFFKDVWDTATGGAESAVDELDGGAWLDNLEGVVDDTGIGDIVGDVLDDGTPDDTFNELTDDILDPVGLGGDPTTPLGLLGWASMVERSEGPRQFGSSGLSQNGYG